MKSEVGKEQVEEVLSRAMSEWWDDGEVDELERRLTERFPRHAKTVARIVERAGDASNTRSELESEDDKELELELERDYDRQSAAVMRAIAKLPWTR